MPAAMIRNTESSLLPLFLVFLCSKFLLLSDLSVPLSYELMLIVRFDPLFDVRIVVSPSGMGEIERAEVELDVGEVERGEVEVGEVERVKAVKMFDELVPLLCDLNFPDPERTVPSFPSLVR